MMKSTAQIPDKIQDLKPHDSIRHECIELQSINQIGQLEIKRKAETIRRRPLRIAMIGQKGIPATYGGVEHHVENLSAELVKLDHEVTVFCRPHYSQFWKEELQMERLDQAYFYRGIKLAMLPSAKTKHLDTISHSVLASFVASFAKFDIVHYHGIGPSLANILPWLFRKNIICTVHALDYRQKKWGPVARFFLRLGLRSALSHSKKLILVSSTFGSDIKGNSATVYIPNGVPEPLPWGIRELKWLREKGLEPHRYLLFVGRLIEDKRCHLLCQAIEQIEGYRLAVAGDSCFTDDYAQRLRNNAGSKTIFLGNVYGSKLSALYANCALFILPSAVEGLPIVLLEAMRHGAPVLVSDIPENLQVVKPTNEQNLGLTFRVDDQAHLLQMIKYANNRRDKILAMARRAKAVAAEYYTWPEIAKKVEQVYYDILNQA